MSASNLAHPAPRMTGVSWTELSFFLVVLIGGFFFLSDATHWGRAAYVGSAQFGDAEFWWNGALHFSQGIVKENPNITFRMGYAAFGGLVIAVCGPDYRIFHQLLLVLFLGTACGLYVSLRSVIGRVAAAASIVFLVFNPFTAEWLAISTSDGLGLVLNVVALLALIKGVHNGVHLRWILAFGIFFACASLTRPLMTSFIIPAALTVIWATWGEWWKLTKVLVVMVMAFILPTIAWMTFMAATTGNFALSGSNQDSSSFYAASDPQIQVWRGDMYDAVQSSARTRFETEQPTSKELNAEFWHLTRTNYQRHWRYHVDRFGSNAFEIARFTPQRSGVATATSEHWRIILKGALILVLGSIVLRQRRWLAATGVLALGTTWVLVPSCQPWLVIGVSCPALAFLHAGRFAPFLWAAYWWVGVVALYLIGGTWGPPLGAAQDLNALGYRLGFQFFFVGDLLVIGLLGFLASGAERPALNHALFQPSPWAGRITRLGLRWMLALLTILLGTGSVLVASRLVARAKTTPEAYPNFSSLQSLEVFRDTAPLTDITTLRTAVNAQAGAKILTQAMSSGFVWNLPGQQRSMLLLYQQEHIQPVSMHPNRFYAEVSRHLPERAWKLRQGAWLLRSFSNTAQTSNLPFYFEVPAIQAFVPLSEDERSYDLDRAEFFPLAKSATQLAASGELVFENAVPEWSLTSGELKSPRRFALRITGEGSDLTARLQVVLTKARGESSFRFGVRLEPARPTVLRGSPVYLHLWAPGSAGGTLWGSDLDPNHPIPLSVSQSAPANAHAFSLTAYHLEPGDTLWFYELVLTADDFAQ